MIKWATVRVPDVLWDKFAGISNLKTPPKKLLFVIINALANSFNFVIHSFLGLNYDFVDRKGRGTPLNYVKPKCNK